jgi:integral membrane protein
MTPDKDIQRFLQVGHAEGISYLVLLGIAMPLKYFFDLPQAVRMVGSLHGILFVAFIFMIAWLVVQKKMSILSAVKAFVLSLVPFGTFYLNRLVAR